MKVGSENIGCHFGVISWRPELLLVIDLSSVSRPRSSVSLRIFFNAMSPHT
jgi:hypothetical protein